LSVTIYEGGGRRSNAEKYGCTVYLCPEHHRGDTGVHKNRDLDLKLKRLCQKEFESKVGTREEFMRLFRRNYLAEDI